MSKLNKKVVLLFSLSFLVIASLALFFISSSPARAYQQLPSGFQVRSLTIPASQAGGTPQVFNYKIYIPSGYNPNVKWPIILTSSGSGEFGTNNISQLGVGLGPHLSALGEKAVVVFPQWHNPFAEGKTPSGFRSLVEVTALQQTMAEVNTDYARIYATGNSSGGFQTWETLYRYPNIFAAGISAAGGVNYATVGLPSVASEVDSLLSMPIWQFAADDDGTVPYATYFTPIVNEWTAKNSLGNLHKYTLYHAIGGHGPTWDTAFSSPATWTWLFSQTKNGTVTPPAPAPDTTAPSVPAGLVATATGTSSVSLSWNSSTDNTGVTGYKIYRGGVQVGTSSTVSYFDTGLSASTTYSYQVSAYDAAGNNSGQSASVSSTTSSPATSGGYKPITSGFNARTVVVDGVSRGYQLYIPPNYNPATKYRVILFLNGSGENGSNNTSQITVGLGKYITNNGNTFPDVAVFPQTPSGFGDGTVDSASVYRIQKAVLDAAEAEVNTDFSRVIVTGISSGATFTWTMAYQNPAHFAAIAPIASAMEPRRILFNDAATVTDAHAAAAKTFTTLPIHTYFGTADNAAIGAMMQADAVALAGNPNFLYTTISGADHGGSWDTTYSSSVFWTWLRAQVKGSASTPPSSTLSTKFTVGQRIQTTGSTLNVRATANSTGAILGTQPSGAVGTVVSGGISQGGYFWWNINYDTGADGWSAEDFLTSYVAPPVVTPPAPTPTPIPDTTAPSTKFTIGNRVQTTSNVNVRATANVKGTLLGAQASGKLGTIVGGPVNQGGYNWWNINYDTDADGWSAEDFLSAYTAPTTPSTPTSTTPTTSGVPTITSFTITPSSITTAGFVALSWATSKSSNCNLTGGYWNNAGISLTGSTKAYVSGNTTYTIVCRNSVGASSPAVATVTVGAAPATTPTPAPTPPKTEPTPPTTTPPVTTPTTTPPTAGAPTVTFSASPSSIPAGSLTTLKWSSTNAKSCSIYGAWWNGNAISLSSSSTIGLTATTSFTVKCTNETGSTSQSTTVTVGSTKESAPTSPTVPATTPTSETSNTTSTAPVPQFTFTCPGLQCTLDASSSTSANGIATYKWVWGDGRSESHTVPTVKNTWAAPGTYTVTLTVTDNKGLTGVISKSVTVPANSQKASVFASSVTIPAIIVVLLGFLIFVWYKARAKA